MKNTSFFSPLLVLYLYVLISAYSASLCAQPLPNKASFSANSPFPKTASGRFDLQLCIDIALQNNLTLRQSQLQRLSSDVQLRQARFNRLPNVGAYVSQGYNTGRNINPVTNNFIDQSVLSNNIQASMQVTVFNGGQLQYAIRQNELLSQSSEATVKATENAVILAVLQQYIGVLTGQEQLTVAQRQREVAVAQLNRTQKQVDAGTLPESSLYDIRAQIATDDLAVMNAYNQIDLAKLALLQAMNLPVEGTTVGNFEVEPVSVTDPSPGLTRATSEEIYGIASEFIPDVKAADLRVRSDAFGVKVARASLLPSLVLNGSISSLYSSVGLQRQISLGTVTDVNQTIILNGSPATITSQQPDVYYENYNFIQQINNNLNRSLALQLQIPIFSRSQNRQRVSSAQLQQQNSELIASGTRLQLRQTIEIAYTGLRTSGNRYMATLAQVAQLEQAFQAAESRFNAGTINATDYTIAKSNLDRARASLVQYKYDYFLRSRTLDFYQNKSFTY